jgi:diaminohydroxyphosphoribosylaminopyrimidine deaminase/5-amino-6-(5-phosphoribosylamino)uracil reductase
MNLSEADVQRMREAMALASKGGNSVAPNPLVGCIIQAENGRIIGTGWHEKCGEAHAEVNAYQSVSPSDYHLLSSSTWYITLEPCNHEGNTPPCAKLIESLQPRRIVVGLWDPNPNVLGGGAKRLKHAGIQIDGPCLTQELQWQNRRFLHNQHRGQTWVVLKWAASQDGFMDGRLAPERTAGAGSFPITGEEARSITHAWRAAEDAIAVGAHTVLVDEPQLTVRDAVGSSPRAVILDPHGIVPAEHPIFQLHPNAIHVVESSNLTGHPVVCPWKMNEGLATLKKRLFRDFGISSLFVEGGATVLDAFLRENEWDELRTWTAPTLLGQGLLAPVLPDSRALPPQLEVSEGWCGKDRWNWWLHAKHSETFQLPLPSRQ